MHLPILVMLTQSWRKTVFLQVIQFKDKHFYFHLSGYFLKPNCFVYFSLVKLDQVVYIASLDLEIKLSNLNHLNKWILTEVAFLNVAI